MVTRIPPMAAPAPEHGWLPTCPARGPKKKHAPVWVIRDDDSHLLLIQCMYCNCDDSSHGHVHTWVLTPAATIMQRQQQLGTTDNTVKTFLSSQSANLYQFDLSAALGANANLQVNYCAICGVISINIPT